MSNVVKKQRLAEKEEKELTFKYRKETKGEAYFGGEPSYYPPVTKVEEFDVVNYIGVGKFVVCDYSPKAFHPGFAQGNKVRVIQAVARPGVKVKEHHERCDREIKQMATTEAFNILVKEILAFGGDDEEKGEPLACHLFKLVSDLIIEEDKPDKVVVDYSYAL